jgi:hypothetical protein
LNALSVLKAERKWICVECGYSSFLRREREREIIASFVCKDADRCADRQIDRCEGSRVPWSLHG